jgi:hypothetical protein
LPHPNAGRSSNDFDDEPTRASGDMQIIRDSPPKYRGALAYADQAERDHAALQAAVGAGFVEVQLER